jgi:glycosidase
MSSNQQPTVRRPVRSWRVRSATTLAIALVAAVAGSITFADRPQPGAQPVVAEARRHTFTLDTRGIDPKPTSVSVAGSFNGWNATATPMRDDDGDGVHQASVELADGQHLYKFVLDGNRWIADPRGDKTLEEPDGYGGLNSGLIVGPDARNLPAPKPDAINRDGVVHDPASVLDVNVADDKTVRFRVRTQSRDITRAEVTVVDGQSMRTFPMHRVGTGLGYDAYGGVATTGAREVSYWFTLHDGNASVILDRQGVRSLTSGTDVEIRPDGFPLTVHTPFVTPAWARDAVWYQIFPERFRNGDASNDPGAADFENLLPWTADWWKTHVDHGETAGEENFYTGTGNVWARRFGGDLQGVKQSLPYLRELGVNAIYFNPIFEADSMHKYDTSDFRHVDDNFGVRGDLPIAGETDDPATWQWSASDKVFLDFVAEAHRQGFKVIVDGVFNHVGRSHPFFRDVLEKGKNSRYADWFEITDWGDPAHWRPMADPFAVHGKPGGIQWKAWDAENGHLPAFRKDPQLGLAKGPRDHIFAITKRWLAPDGDPSRGIDGFRLDVPGDIPHPFWIDWRQLVKTTKPDAYITGEIWSWAQPWLGGDQFDAVMNYQFAMPAQAFFVNRAQSLEPSVFSDRLAALVYNYPLQVALVQQNLFDSHDTDRLASMFVNPDRPYDGANRLQDNGPDYDRRKPTDAEFARMLQAIDVQMTFVGAPMLYYGTEAGMWSPDDPSNRQPMIWRDLLPYDDRSVTFRQDVFEHVQRLIALRSHFPALRQGSFDPLVADDDADVLAFGRSLDGRQVIVAVNRSDQPRTVTIPAAKGVYRNWLDRNQASVAFADAGERSRPTVKPTGEASLVAGDDGRLTITLPPHRSAVLAAE